MDEVIHSLCMMNTVFFDPIGSRPGMMGLELYIEPLTGGTYQIKVLSRRLIASV